MKLRRIYILLGTITTVATISLGSGCSVLQGITGLAETPSPTPKPLSVSGEWIFVRPGDTAFSAYLSESDARITGFSGHSTIDGSRNGDNVIFTMTINSRTKPVYSGTLASDSHALVGRIDGDDYRPFTAMKRPAGVGSLATVEVDEWEYLVVTSGRVYFYDPQKQATESVASFSSTPFTDEAVGTQRALDKLGEDGWELVTVVGAIGGDQEFILKRRKRKA